MSLKAIEKELQSIAQFDEQSCKLYRTRIKEALRESRMLPVGLRAASAVNRTFLRLIGQKDLSSLAKSGFVANLKYLGGGDRK